MFGFLCGAIFGFFFYKFFISEPAVDQLKRSLTLLRESNKALHVTIDSLKTCPPNQNNN